MSRQVDVDAVSNQEMEKNTHVLPVSPVATDGTASEFICGPKLPPEVRLFPYITYRFYAEIYEYFFPLIDP